MNDMTTDPSSNNHPDASPASGELDDVATAPTTELVRFNRRLLTDPVIVRAVGGIAIGCAVLAWPDRTDRILVRLLGVAFIWIAVSALWTAVHHRALTAIRVFTAVGGAAAGGFLIRWPEQSEITLGRLVGASLVLLSIRTYWVRRKDPETKVRGVRLTASAISGIVLFAFPAETLSAATVALAVAWIIVSTIAIFGIVDRHDINVDPDASVSDVALAWLANRHKAADAREKLYDKILFDGPDQPRRITRFFTLMTFASIIAAMGVLTDSTAIVIGAMLIAPLMTPLMAIAISLVMGWPNRLAMAVLIATAGILLAIGIGVLLGLVVPVAISPSTNSQIVSRSTPTPVDLITALTAGAAGAYGLSRPDVTDSLPGVAIAISLVPPLSVVGISYSQAEWAAGNGALLLFMTNMVAILMMGGITFVMTGVTPLSVVYEGQRRVRTALTSVLLLALIVVGGLLLNGKQVTSDSLDQSRTVKAVTTWLKDAPLHQLVESSVDGDVVNVVVIGPVDGLANVDDLADELSASFGRNITADVRIVVEERVTSSGSQP
ncbi:MAG: DUF389 domain-containing protein [Ilumatobacter sp.]|jgi:uncharacterized hydrophobic protein (TIGR00271 family)|nr:DUF389 domain-containing protein [Ilumatobacter sp.]MDG1696823.1 DUF389 domain-containing protein [Ilumatobacter sp.]